MKENTTHRAAKNNAMCKINAIRNVTVCVDILKTSVIKPLDLLIKFNRQQKGRIAQEAFGRTQKCRFIH